MRMATLSITIIGHNEADHLQELLPQLSWADEVVYVDCDSEDDSLAVAKNHGCRSFSRPNNRNLNVNKSFGIEQTSSDWVFYLDPDERLPEELVQEICEIKGSNTPHVAFRSIATTTTLGTGSATEASIRTRSYAFSERARPSSRTDMSTKSWKSTAPSASCTMTCCTTPT